MKQLSPITKFARLTLLRHAVTQSQVKHAAIAHGAGLTSGYFSRLWNGHRGLTDAIWPRVRKQLEGLQPRTPSRRPVRNEGGQP